MKKYSAFGVVRFSLALLAICLFTLGATAQIQNGQLTGLISDPSGAAVPGAKVTATNVGTNIKTTSESSESGVFTVRELPIGTYKLSVEASGFKTATKSNIEINAGVTFRIDFRLEVGGASEVVEVTAEAAPVNTVDSKLASTVGGSQIANLPLNGRNVYDLILLAPGAVNASVVIQEQGPGTIVNGARQNFNGFLLNGTSNKQLSGGPVQQPIQDTVAEFQLLTLNNSAQYGNSAGSITNLVTKSGTNNYHGSAWWFNRNDIFDANNFFLNQVGEGKPALRLNQFGGTFGGPVIKDKLFFFGAYQRDSFRTSATPSPVAVESAEFRAAVATAFPNSVANLLYQFEPAIAGTPLLTLDQYLIGGAFSGSGFASYAEYFCDQSYGDPGGQGATLGNNLMTLVGVTAQDITDMGTLGCGNIPGAPFAGAFARNVPFLNSSVALAGAQAKDNLFNGHEWSARVDYNFSEKDRIFGQYNWSQQSDAFGPDNPNNSSGRGPGFLNPLKFTTPNFQFSWLRTFSPTILNEFKFGYASDRLIIDTANPGVPYITFDDGTMGVGSYNGYPQFFKEHIYTYSDMVSISKGSHNLKFGGEVRRNLEHSEFNVARPSYYFFDPLFFAVDAPYEQIAGVNPGLLADPLGNSAELSSNQRHWRNVEFGFYFNDDWKITRNLTLNLGIRYDLYKRHNELNDLATTFIKGPGTNVIDDITTGAGFLRDANILAGDPGCDTALQIASAPLAGVCGPGGFAPTSQLGGGDRNNFGPRVGFAWDVFGSGKTSLRGGYGISYEGTLYNPLSNSRWNLPFYSFNDVANYVAGDVDSVIYGPAGAGCPLCAIAPTFVGGAGNPGQGTGAQATGNLTGWDTTNPNLAFLTGIVFPEGIRDPYVHNWFFGVQHQLVPKLVLEVNYVGTAGHKLFRAEDVNRIPGGLLPTGVQVTDNFGRLLTGRDGRLNQNYGTMRVWQNVVNSNYHSLQASVRKAMSKGFMFNANYTWSHSIDGGSTWHSGATSANGPAGGEGYTTDQTQPGLDRGNSIFDIRHRLVLNYIWELPFFKGAGGAKEGILGGWQLNGILSAQSGAHWSPVRFGRAALTEAVTGSGACDAATFDPAGCINAGGDFNLDRGRNDRPNSTLTGFSGATHDMWANGFGGGFVGAVFSTPCLGCTGNLGRNTFVGPGLWVMDMSLFKNIKVTERVNLQFRAEAFNLFNHTNFQLPDGVNGFNSINNPQFGLAQGTFNARNLQFGLKLSF